MLANSLVAKVVRSGLPILLIAQAAGQVPTGKVQVDPNPKDVSSVDGIIRALYRSVSGARGEKHDWTELRSLFLPNARMGSVWRSKSGEIHYSASAVEQYIANNDKYMTETGYFEKERRRHVEAFGSIAQVFSSYESRTKPNDTKPEFRGINSLQLVNDGKRWWISSIQWQSEDEQLKLPGGW
jgi:hypothetical protein